MQRALVCIALAIAAPGLAATALAQPADLPIAPADGSPLPPGIHVLKANGGKVYADPRGRVLYGLDMRMVLRWAPDPAQYCGNDCSAEWEPLLASPGTQANISYPSQAYREEPENGMIDPRKAPDWTVISGPNGPQWVYKGWHMVFTRRTGDPASTAFDGADGLIWNTLKYIPPVPQISAPVDVTTAFVHGAYVLTDQHGRALFTGKCTGTCGWSALPAPMGSSGLDEWKVRLTGDQAQWIFKGKPVFISTERDPLAVPAAGIVLKP